MCNKIICIKTKQNSRGLDDTQNLCVPGPQSPNSFSRGNLDSNVYLTENPSTPSLTAERLNHLLRTESSMCVSIVFSVVSYVATLSNHLLHIKVSTHHFEGQVPASRCRKLEAKGNYTMLTDPCPHPEIHKYLQRLWVPTGHSLWDRAKGSRIQI